MAFCHLLLLAEGSGCVYNGMPGCAALTLLGVLHVTRGSSSITGRACKFANRLTSERSSPSDTELLRIKHHTLSDRATGPMS